MKVQELKVICWMERIDELWREKGAKKTLVIPQGLEEELLM